MPGLSRRFDLLEQLEAYEPTSAEEMSCDRLIAALREPGDPFSRYRFDPGHVTAGGIVLSPDGAAVLLIHHRRLGQWIEPGGHVDPEDESVLAAALREVIEETGARGLGPFGTGIFDVDAHPIPSGRSEPPHTHFNVTYAMRAAFAGLTVGSEVHAARWVPLDEVATVTSDRAVLRAVAKLASPA